MHDRVERNQEEARTAVCRFLHACTLLPYKIDIYINQRRWIRSLDFGQITYPFELTRDLVEITVTRAEEPGHVLWEKQWKAKDVGNVTLAISQRENSPYFSQYQDDPIPVIGRTKLRLIQLSPDTMPISIATERQVLFSDVSFGDARYLTLSPYPATLSFRVTPSNQLIYQVPKIIFQQGVSYTLFTVGSKKKIPSFRLLLLKDS
ncbi:DUF4397 domain-containing protein [Shimazuella kribbensis]|uniref:DUF4397 domain-containing protein n=1 Tax=Shimazuella kribbensis TaxID=139808 RepID=UPI00041736E0|nr:DUF4397 domain-containing protein [Shimazuella kribbensis]